MSASLSASLPAVAAEQPSARRRVLIVVTHVIQYGSPFFRVLTRDPRLDIQVAYCSMQGAERGMDPEFKVEIQWDVPLLDGYSWVHVPNKSPKPGLGRFFGLWNPGLWRMIRSGNFDAVVIYTGYMYASFWCAVLAAKSAGIPVLISSDATTLQPRDGARWKLWVKPFVLGRVYRTIDVLMAGSAAVRELALRLGMPDERIQIIRSGMVKEEWAARLEKFDRSAVRASWNIPESAPVVFYCAKLQGWKRPLDLLRAFARTNAPDAYLVYAGDGPQRKELEEETRALGIENRVRILGFVNQSQLPGMYKASDIFVLPSEYDPCPLVVPEAMFSGLPVVLSDAVRGRMDMIDTGKSGYTYRCGDIEELAAILNQVLGDPELLARLKTGVRKQMEAWTLHDFLDSWVGAIELARRYKAGKKGTS
ncbi:MAG TPA: glycosyltransferase [Candidatus Acidoferrum sp.]|nr:glycosyltransferase [Candidatus Acidoferrum sp.]